MRWGAKERGCFKNKATLSQVADVGHVRWEPRSLGFDQSRNLGQPWQEQVQCSIKEGRIDEKVEAADTDNSLKDLLKREGRNGSVGGMDRQGFKFFFFLRWTIFEYIFTLMGICITDGEKFLFQGKKKILAETKSFIGKEYGFQCPRGSVSLKQKSR